VGADYSLKGGTMKAVDSDITYTFDWSDMTAKYPPDPAAPR
jgi:hypothetical protein